MEDITTHTFSNGLPAVYLNHASSKVYTAILIVGVGSRFETKELQGISRFYANICFQGNQDYPDKDQLDQAIDNLGLIIKPAVYPEYSLYYFSSQKDQFLASLNLFLTTIYQPALTEEGLSQEKKLSLAEVEISTRNPQIYSLNKLTSAIFNDDPLSFDALGSTLGTQNINLNHLNQFKDKYYLSQNSLLIIVGPDQDFNLASLENITSKISPGKRQPLPSFDFSQVKTIQEKINQPGKISYLSYGFLCFGRNSQQRISQNLLLNILSEGRNNQRLKSLQQNKLTGLVKPWIKIFSDCGLMLIQTNCQSSQEQPAHQAILDQLEKLNNNDLTQAELDQAKFYYQNRLLTSLSTPLELGLFYGLSFFFNLPEQNPEQVLEKVKNVSLEEINQTCQNIFRPESTSWIINGSDF